MAVLDILIFEILSSFLLEENDCLRQFLFLN